MLQELLAQAQLGNQRQIALAVLGLEVVEQLAAAAHHAQQATPTVVVFGVLFEVGHQFVDAGCQQRHLHFWAAGVIGGTGVVLDDFGFDGGCDHLKFSG